MDTYNWIIYGGAILFWLLVGIFIFCNVRGK